MILMLAIRVVCVRSFLSRLRSSMVPLWTCLAMVDLKVLMLQTFPLAKSLWLNRLRHRLDIANIHGLSFWPVEKTCRNIEVLVFAASDGAICGRTTLRLCMMALLGFSIGWPMGRVTPLVSVDMALCGRWALSLSAMIQWTFLGGAGLADRKSALKRFCSSTPSLASPLCPCL